MERIDPFAVAIGKAVRGAIAQAGLEHGETATRLGMGRNSLSRRVNGSIPFTWPEVVRIAELTGTTATELATTADRLAKAPA